MKKLSLFLLTGFCIHASLQAQVSIGIPSPDPSAELHVSSPNKGILFPNMPQSNRPASPATSLLIYQTDNTPGFYYNAGTAATPDWQRLGNGGGGGATNTSVDYNPDGTLTIASTAGNISTTQKAWVAGGNNFGTSGTPYYFGTTSNDHVDLISNNSVRGRLANTGEIIFGGTVAPLAGGAFSGLSTAAGPFAVNGYSTGNGSGIYGNIAGTSTTAFAAVQGENISTLGNVNSAGVRGINGSAVAGSGYRPTATAGPRTGVQGTISNAGGYSFGVYGSNPVLSTRTGGVFGDAVGFTSASLGYVNSTANVFSVYGFGLTYGTGTTGGRSSNFSGNNTAPNNVIGLGMYGGVMGGWIRGQQYGAHIKGERYSLYVDGKSYTNEPVTQLMETANGDRVATYSTASFKTDVNLRGRAKLSGGTVFVPFDANFQQVISADPDELVITVSPAGNSNGIYISSYDRKGFYVKENNNGHSDVSFSWIAIGTRKGFENPQTAPELLSKDFDANMDKVMHNENDPSAAKAIWWDGTNIRFDAPQVKPQAEKTFTGARVN